MWNYVKDFLKKYFLSIVLFSIVLVLYKQNITNFMGMYLLLLVSFDGLLYFLKNRK